MKLEEGVGNSGDVLARHKVKVEILRLGVDQWTSLMPPILCPANLQLVEIEPSSYPTDRLGCGSETLPLATGYAYRLRQMSPPRLQLVYEVGLEFLRVCVCKPAGVSTHACARQSSQGRIRLSVPQAVSKTSQLRLKLLLFAFLDFREIYDDEYGSWGKLCYALDGRPVESVEEEVKQVRYEVLIRFFRDLLAQEPVAARELSSVSSKLRPFLRELLVHTRWKGEPLAMIAAAIEELHLIQRLASSTPPTVLWEPVSALRQMIESEFGRTIVPAWLYLHQAGKLAGEASFEEQSAELLGKYGLARAVEEKLNVVSGDWPPTVDARSAMLLLRIMIRRQLFFSGLEEKGFEEGLRQLFADPEASDFLFVHESDGIEWFNKERFEVLLGWLFLAVTAGLGTRANEWPAELAAYHQGMLDLQAIAEKAGYRVRVFLDSLKLTLAPVK